MKNLSDYRDSLESIREKCLSNLGKTKCPAWSKSKEEQQELEVRHREQRKSYAVAQSNIAQSCRNESEFYQRRSDYIAEQITNKKTAIVSCHEMTNLACSEIRKAHPELILKYSWLKYYDHQFFIIVNPTNFDDQWVFDLFAAGFNKPVLYPAKQLETNMKQIPLERLTNISSGVRNKLGLDEWQGPGNPPYEIVTEFELGHFSYTNYCAKVGLFSVTVITAGAAYALMNYYSFKN